MFEQPELYGIQFSNTDYYKPIPYKEISVDTNIANLVTFAKDQKILYRELKELNPWLRGKSLPKKGTPYIIRIPLKSEFKYMELY
jgi:hypothetical protein